MAAARISPGKISLAIAANPEKYPVPKNATNGPSTRSQKELRAIPYSGTSAAAISK